MTDIPYPSNKQFLTNALTLHPFLFYTAKNSRYSSIYSSSTLIVWKSLLFIASGPKWLNRGNCHTPKFALLIILLIDLGFSFHLHHFIRSSYDYAFIHCISNRRYWISAHGMIKCFIGLRFLYPRGLFFNKNTRGSLGLRIISYACIYQLDLVYILCMWSTVKLGVCYYVVYFNTLRFQLACYSSFKVYRHFITYVTRHVIWIWYGNLKRRWSFYHFSYWSFLEVKMN